MNKQERSKFFSDLVKKRWAKTTPEQRSAYASKIRKKGIENLSPERRMEISRMGVEARKAKRTKREVDADIKRAIKFGGLK